MIDTIDEVIDRYLNEMSWAMGGSLAQQQTARDEVRAHIFDQARDLELQGVERGSAIVTALHDLGDASEVGRAMRASRRGESLRRPLRQPDGALAFGPRRERHVPPAAVLVALGAAVATSGVVALVYAWPG